MRKVILLVSLFVLLGCETEIPVRVEVIVEVEKDSPLRFSGTASSPILAKDNAWTGEGGVILFVKAFNSGDSTWYGYPELNTYVFVQDQNAPGDLVSTGQGIMTSRVSYGIPVPIDTLANEIPAQDIRRTLTFAPVDWSLHPNGVWIYWRFVEQANQSIEKSGVFNKDDFVYINRPETKER